MIADGVAGRGRGAEPLPGDEDSSDEWVGGGDMPGEGGPSDAEQAAELGLPYDPNGARGGPLLMMAAVATDPLAPLPDPDPLAPLPDSGPVVTPAKFDPAHSDLQANPSPVLDDGTIVVTGRKAASSAGAQPAKFASRREFFAYAIPHAIRSERETGVPAAITLAQAAIESGNGNRHIGSANNYFGVKAFKSKTGEIKYGEVATGYVTVPTREVIDGKSIIIMDHFRKYDSMADSFTDHGRFLVTNKRYAGILTEYTKTGDTAAYARGLQKAGYATDPNYAKMIISIVNKYNLNQYNLVQPRAR